jgi:hypothetical protein
MNVTSDEKLHSTLYFFYGDEHLRDRSQRPRSLKHEPSSSTRTLVSWVRIPLEARLSLYAFISGLVTG